MFCSLISITFDSPQLAFYYKFQHHSVFVQFMNPFTNNIPRCIFQKQPFPDVLQNDVLKTFAIFTRKHLCQGLFLIKLQAFNKNRLQHKCFPAIITRFLRTLVFAEHLRWLLLVSRGPKAFLRN